MMPASHTLCRIAPLLLGWCACLLMGCSSQRVPANHKLAPGAMQHDLDVLWQTYRQVHPGYDWYTPADTVNNRFAAVRSSFTDSLTEPEFRKRLSFAVAAIRCGHTTVKPSKQALQSSRGQRVPLLPLQVRVWGTDSMVVTDNRWRRDSVFTRGTIITHINGKTVATMLADMMPYISGDGYNVTFKHAAISSNFAARYRLMYGDTSQYRIGYVLADGRRGDTVLRPWMPPKPDSLKAAAAQTAAKRPAQPKAPGSGVKLQIDSSGQFAVLDVPSFSSKGIRRQAKKSFKTLQRKSIPNLVIDLRANTGGSLGKSTALSRYVASKPFKEVDSAWARTLHFPYSKQVQAHLFYQLFGWSFTKKRADGYLHLASLERKWHKPRHKYHYQGQVYVLTSGLSFSASILFIQNLRRNNNVTLVGEETGGGARGNSAIMTPDITLPYSKVRARLPLFRLVTDTTLPDAGRGIMPQVEVPYSSYNFRNNIDGKMEAVRKLIAQRSLPAHMRQ